jgi:hypothetical protein
MMLTPHPTRASVAAVLIAVVLVAFPIIVTDANAGTGNGVVRCMAAHQPVQALTIDRAFGLPIGRGRFFAPTRPAVFFSRAGDRCAWRPGGPAKG